ncbi:hypothetical protein MTR_3g025405 [Medicago truncatula]|uniref:Uncharacterized protein n=1 Tax=Medicago truncatula TaxID=3880 RepID=A0A072UUU0_MEDTR|nr:hypothetical protein MTR_3g025405 [Medicago truncatula]
MEAMIIQQKFDKALKGENALPVTMSQAEKTEMVDKVRSAMYSVGIKFQRCRKGTNCDIDVVKVGVFVYDKVFGSSAIPKETTLLIQDGGVKGYHGATYGVLKNP